MAIPREEYQRTRAKIAGLKEELKTQESLLKVWAEKVFDEDFGVKRGDVFLFRNMTGMLVVGFCWGDSMFGDVPKAPTLLVSKRKGNGEWSKTLVKLFYSRNQLEKTGSDAEAAELLRMRA